MNVRREICTTLNGTANESIPREQHYWYDYMNVYLYVFVLSAGFFMHKMQIAIAQWINIYRCCVRVFMCLLFEFVSFTKKKRKKISSENKISELKSLIIANPVCKTRPKREIINFKLFSFIFNCVPSNTQNEWRKFKFLN